MAAAAYAGMSEAEFWRTSPAFLHARINAKKSDEKAQAELVRILAYYAAHSGRIKPTPNIKKFWPLPWDRSVKIKEVDLSEMQPLLDAMDKALIAEKQKEDGTN